MLQNPSKNSKAQVILHILHYNNNIKYNNTKIHSSVIAFEQILPVQRLLLSNIT